MSIYFTDAVLDQMPSRCRILASILLSKIKDPMSDCTHSIDMLIKKICTQVKIVVDLWTRDGFICHLGFCQIKVQETQWRPLKKEIIQSLIWYTSDPAFSLIISYIIRFWLHVNFLIMSNVKFQDQWKWFERAFCHVMHWWKPSLGSNIRSLIVPR